MRKWFVLLWLLAGVGIYAFHYNYGQKHIKRVEAWEYLKEIQALEKEEDMNLDDILMRYNDDKENSMPKDLVDLLPEDEEPIVFHQIRLKQSRLRLDALDIGNALNELYELLDECSDEYGDDAKITQAVRESLGKAHYMAAWVLHGSGAPEKEWRPYAERARQVFRYLAEHKDTKAYNEYETKVDEAVKNISMNQEVQ